MVNANSSETSNLDNIINEMPPQDSNNANKNKEHENLCPVSFKLKGKYFSIATNYNEWFGLVTYTRIISDGIYSLETLHPEWHNNKNPAFNNKLSHTQFIVATDAILNYSTGNPDNLVLGALKEISPKTKCSLFGIEQFIKRIKKEGKLNGIVIDKSTQKYMITDEVVIEDS